ncbi:MAG: group 1 glycosyl transferase, partial [Cyanobacteria bacterium J06635_11]
MHKLIILPGATDALGGTLVTLSLLIKGLSQRNLNSHFCVLTRAGSLMESYLTAAGHRDALQLIEGECDRTFVANALKWVNQQPHQAPLLLDNCIAR